MKRLINNIAGALLLLSMVSNACYAQDKATLALTLSYFANNNTVPYLLVTAKTKVDGKFQPVKGIKVKLYLVKDSTGRGVGNIGDVVTNDRGQAAATIPPALSAIWRTTPAHTFMAVAEPTKKFDETNAEINIAKARLALDTGEDKAVTAVLSEYKDGTWVPVKGVDVKLGIKRMDADLQIGDKDTYTTDSLGKVSGTLTQLGLPGDEKGNILLTARVEDNDKYGNLRVEKSVRWGNPFTAGNQFNQRALWGTHFRTPYWLMFMAYSILFTVWGVIVYLITLLVKIKKLGRLEA